MAYPMAPWIRPADNLGQDYLGGLRAGAEIAHQKAALAQQASLQSMELGLKQQQMQRENMLEQQKLEVTKAYHTQQTQLMSQRLEQAQQMTAIKTQQAAQQYAAKQAYQKDLAGGMAPLDAIMKNFPGTDESMTGYGQIARMMAQDKTPMPPASVENFQFGGKNYPQLRIPEGAGKFKYQPLHEGGRDVEGDTLYNKQVEWLERKRNIIESDIQKNYSMFDGMSDADVEKLTPLRKKEYDKYLTRKNAVDNLDNQIGQMFERAPGNPASSGGPHKTQTGASGDGRVKVRAPSGKTGTIPADQLDEALKAGYSKVEDSSAHSAPAPDAVTPIGTMPAINGEMPFGPSTMQTPWSAPMAGPRPPTGMMPSPSMGQFNEDAITQQRRAMFLKMMQQAAQQGAIRPPEDFTGAGNDNPEDYAPYDSQGHPHYVQ